MIMNLLEEIQIASQRIYPHCLKTPLLYSAFLSKLINGSVHLKLENEQVTGSFKARGSLNKILSLTSEESEKGVITASTGNHALGVARALSISGVHGVIYLPEGASKSKVNALANYPVELRTYGRNSLETELHAKQVAFEKGAIWISPYNDPKIIAGQGTIGKEILEQTDQIDHILVTIGGGGLVSGIATYLKSKIPDIRITGCQPEHSPEMSLSVQAGKIVEIKNQRETLSDGSAGGVEPGSITFPLCQQLVDEYILVSEDEIKKAIRIIAEKHKKIIEGAAGVAVGAFLKDYTRFMDSNVVIVICGGNIDFSTLKSVLSGP
jgi:threonine dehydratase